MIRKTELYSSFQMAALALEQAFKDGWRLDPNDPPTDFGHRFELVLFHDGEPKVRRDRAEILAEARAAKAAKRQQTVEVAQ